MPVRSDSPVLPASVPWWNVVGQLRAHPFAADAALGVFLCGLGIAGLYFLPDHEPRASTSPNALAVLLTATMTLPLAWRRRYPRVVLATAMVGLIPFLIFDFSDNGASLGTLVAMYSVGAHCPRRRSLPAFLITALVMLPVMIAGTLVDYVALPWAAVIGNYAVYFTAWVLGDSLRTRRAYLRELEHRAETAERQRDEEARQAVAAERDRIARELHDVVAHSMAVMVVQAGAARRVLHSRPEQADEALRQVEATGRDGMVEMRRLVGVLRDDDDAVDDGADRSPQPGLDALPALVEQWRQAGLPIELEISGDPRSVPVGVDLSAYRIVQEALTNTFKHAGSACARVQVSYGSDDVEVQIVDDGRGLVSELAARDPAGAGHGQPSGSGNRRKASGNGSDGGAVRNGGGVASGGRHDDVGIADGSAVDQNGGAGHGLLGMRERVALVGGDLRVGPRTGGGFEVAARLPLGAARINP